jgi:hypothetical protein
MARYNAVMIIATFAGGGYSSSSPASSFTVWGAAFSTSPVRGSSLLEAMLMVVAVWVV